MFVGTRTITDYKLWAINIDSGEVNWSFELDNSTFRDGPTVANGIVFVPDTDDTVYAIDVETGTELWSKKFNQIRAPMVVDGVLYVVGDRMYAVKAGVNNSSTDSRVALGTLGQHEPIAQSSGETPVFGILIGVATLIGGGYLLKKKQN